MSDKSLIKFPVEILHKIFDYLDAHTIFHSVEPVCTELSAVVKTYNRFKLDLTLFPTSDWRFITDFIKPENIIALKVFNNDQTVEYGLNSFFALFKRNRFTGLKSLTLIEISGTELSQFLQHIIYCPLLVILSINFPCRSEQETHRIIDLISSTVEQIHLQSLYLDISYNEFMIDIIHKLGQHVLRYLSLRHCTYQKYHVILSCCLRLQTLVMLDCETRDMHQTVLPSSARDSYPQLTSLTIQECSSSIDELYSLLSLTPSLVRLKIISYGVRCELVYNGHRWEPFIRTKLLLLKNFQFRFRHNVSGSEICSSLVPIISPFKTSFWMKDKNWNVTCEYELISSQIILYTKLIHVRAFEVIIRCDPNSLNSSHHLLTRQWLNHVEYVSTEQTLSNLDLSNVTITIAGANLLAKSLQSNTILRSLTLEQNALTTQGLEYLANTLEHNKTLSTLHCTHNKISDDGIQNLMNGLKYNTALTVLNLGHNRIESTAAKHFEAMLQQNSTLIDLNIQHNRLGDTGAQAFANALSTNKTLNILNLEQNGIGAAGAKFLADGLRNNTSLVSLDLQSNTIGDEGMISFANTLLINTTLKTLNVGYSRIDTLNDQHLKDALQKNKVLTTLNLTGNSIDASGAKHLADGLRMNTSLTTLVLTLNQIGALGAQYLASVLEDNRFLITLDLRANKIGSLGAQYLSNALRKNNTLTTLELRSNDIGPEGGEYLANVLRENTTLTTLILEKNRIGDQGAQYLAQALQTNQTLKTLNLAQNNIQETGAKSIADALETNTTIIILDIRGSDSIPTHIIKIIEQLLERNRNH